MIKHVVKKNGSVIDWDEGKIIKAVNLSAERVNEELSPYDEIDLIAEVKRILAQSKKVKDGTVKVADIHDAVEKALIAINEKVHVSYAQYRNYKKEHYESFKELIEESDTLKYGVKTENAVKDSTVISTKAALLNEATMKQLVRQTMLKPEWVEAHDQGYIYIHDLGDLWKDTLNCDLFDMGRLVKNKQWEDGEYAFVLNGEKYHEPKSVLTLFTLMADITLSASSCQFGGFTIPSIDTIASHYAEKTYHNKVAYYVENGIEHHLAKDLAYKETRSQIRQGVQSFTYTLGTCSNALGQTPQLAA